MMRAKKSQAMLHHDGQIFRGVQCHVFPKQLYPRLLSSERISISCEMRVDCIMFSKRHVQRQQAGGPQHVRPCGDASDACDACDA